MVAKYVLSVLLKNTLHVWIHMYEKAPALTEKTHKSTHSDTQNHCKKIYDNNRDEQSLGQGGLGRLMRKRGAYVQVALNRTPIIRYYCR